MWVFDKKKWVFSVFDGAQILKGLKKYRPSHFEST